MGITDEAEVYLRVTVGTGALTGEETERQITDRVAAFLRRVPLSAPAVHGLIIDLEEPIPASALLVFGLVDLAVAAKGAKAGLRISFILPPGFTEQHGDVVKRLATYTDLLGVAYRQGWEKEAQWIAEQALNKPIILKLSAAQSASYLAAALASSETAVQIVWADPPDSQALAGLCAVNNIVSRFITTDMRPVATGERRRSTSQLMA